MSSDQIVLFPGEADQMVQSLKPMLPDDIGNAEWYKQQEYIDKLNLQALLSATNKTDEFIKEFLITHQKLDVLIECLICIEIWKEKVFVKLVEKNINLSQNFGIYSILYHEATVLNLLETVLYHEDAIESLQNGILDLFDYCYRRLCNLLSHCDNMDHRIEIVNFKSGKSDGLTEEKIENRNKNSQFQELVDQEKVIKYEISLKCLSIMNYFINYIKSLPLSVSNRLFSTFDMPIVLVGIIEKSPWIVEMPNGILYKFIDNKFVQQNNWLQMRNSITKLEGQVWLSIYQLILSDKCREKYEINGYRKATILRLRSHLSNVLMDQLPMLEDLRKFLEQMAISESPIAKPSLILEQIAEFRDTILTTYDNKWEVVIQRFCEYLNSSRCQEDLKRQAETWSAMYNLDNIDHLIYEVPRCVVCGNEAAKRCSRCKAEWYCRRECQVQHWKRHKVACDLLVDVAKK